MFRWLYSDVVSSTIIILTLRSVGMEISFQHKGSDNTSNISYLLLIHMAMFTIYVYKQYTVFPIKYIPNIWEVVSSNPISGTQPSLRTSGVLLSSKLCKVSPLQAYMA